MGKVRTKTIKKSAKLLVEKYFQRLTNDFQTNKKVTADVTIMPSKRVRNKVAGYVTVLMKRIARSSTGVRGISLKLQEEERERKLDFVPEVSALDKDEKLFVDAETESMLAAMGMSDLKRVQRDVPNRGGAGNRRDKPVRN